MFSRLFFSIAILLLATPVKASIIDPGGVIVSSPVGAWRYSELVSAGHGSSITYFPTTLAEFTSAVFQDYVTYDAVNVAGIGWTGTGFDTIQTFETNVLSSIDQSIAIRIGGDDGHSLFVDDVFIGGGGFGATIDHLLVLSVGVAKKITLAGYNGPGNWVFGIGVQGTGDTIANPINDVAGVQLNADGDFSAIPEPSSFIIWLIGLTFAHFGWRRRRTRRNQRC